MLKQWIKEWLGINELWREVLSLSEPVKPKRKPTVKKK
jgi:hypothetical protein